MERIFPNFSPRTTSGAKVIVNTPGSWRLEIPPGSEGHYRLAQIDDYASLPRRLFPWQAPFSISLQMRASAQDIPGTWGFGLWNDPFSLSLGLGGGTRHLPVLPNAAWFFFASPKNYLSIYDNLPASDSLAATFCSKSWSTTQHTLAAVSIPFIFLAPLARLLRRMARLYVFQDAAQLSLVLTDWHFYEIQWQPDKVIFLVDQEVVLQTQVIPVGRMGLVLWVDNQYFSFPASGRLAYGTLTNPETTWIEIKQLVCLTILSQTR